jgi:hypothetical protein
MSSTESQSVDGNVPLQELQETVSRLSSHKGVESVLILNRNGDIVVESGSVASYNLPPTSPTAAAEEEFAAALEECSAQHALRTNKLLEAATSYIQSLQPDDEVAFVQVRSKNNQELMIAPHQGFVLAVLKRS